MPDAVLAFRDFLLRDEPMNDAVREAGTHAEQDGNDPGGRQGLRRIVDDRVFDGRIPRGTMGAVAITLEQIGEITYSAVASPARIYAPLVDINVWARDTDSQNGAERARKLISCLRQYLSQYRGPLNDELETQTIKLEGGPNLFTQQARDASGNWTYRYLSTWMLGIPQEVPAGAD